MATMVEQWAGGRKDLALIATPGRRSPSVSCLQLPPPLTGTAVAERLLRQGWEIGVGEGPGAEGVIRIGHMGEVGAEQLEALLLGLGQVLEALE
jgi:aspartate aminotransferase-like enzyme